jgi:hypothetical protein
VDAVESDESTSSRRGLLRNVALGAAGVAAAGVTGIVAGAGTAGAVDPNDLDLTAASNPHAPCTGANYTGPTVASSFTVESGPTAANNDTILNGVTADGGTALIGIANTGGPQQVGLIGWSKQPLGTGVIGFTGGAGAYGGEFFGGLAEIRLRPNTTLSPPPLRTDAHQVGELYEDADGTLWLNVGAGTPGVWRVLGSATAAGAFHAISPKRVYDSRTSPAGKLAANEDRTISVATSGGIEVIPAGATAIAMTFTVTETEGNGGFVSVRPAGTAYETTSSINWFGPGQNLATTVISALGGDRQLTLFGGVASTHVLADVTGFYR